MRDQPIYFRIFNFELAVGKYAASYYKHNREFMRCSDEVLTKNFVNLDKIVKC